ncbi:MAG TPA: RNA polymerase sigma factor [Candidatus Angelobacter sp.]|nr:RNA polymerase sigma factor [Candidatus Angelobacter sp.]
MDRMHETDASVVAQVLAGDRDAFRLLVERHSRTLYRLVYRMTGNSDDSQEIVQDTFLHAFKGLSRFELRSNFATWIYRIAVNRTLDFLHARKIHDKDKYRIYEEPNADDGTQVQVAATEPGPERMVMSTEMQSKVAQALSLLTPAERLAFTMRHVEGCSIEEISRALNLKTSAAKNSVFRAVRKLRRQLEPFTSPVR